MGTRRRLAAEQTIAGKALTDLLAGAIRRLTGSDAPAP